jgi:metal-dependent amidase/aminoacylase/carboxypeptidase family protein
MGYRPIVHRDASLVKLAREVAAQVLEKPVFDDEFMPGGEDFSFYLEELRGKQIPGAFMIVGGVNPEKGIPKTAHHSPKFRIDPDVLKEMAGINVAFVIDFLSKNEEVLS